MQRKDGSTPGAPLKDHKEALSQCKWRNLLFLEVLTIDSHFNGGSLLPLSIRTESSRLLALQNSITSMAFEPRSIEEAHQQDQESGTNFWHQAILQKMKNNA